MKILQVGLFKATASGPTTVLKPIIQKLNEKEHILSVFSTLGFDIHRKNMVTSLGADYYPLENKKSRTRFKNVLASVPNLETYDLVHIHGVYNINHILLARWLAKKEIPYIVSIHGGLMAEALKKSKYKKKIAIKLLIKNMLAQAASVHALNEQEASDISKIINHSSIKIIPNGVGHTSYQQEEKYLDNEKLNLLFIGRIDVHHKGLDKLFNTLDRDEFRKTVHLYLVGPYADQVDKMYIEKRISKSENLKAIVKVIGPKYGVEKEQYYQKADFFIHTSRYEGMPMAVLEALAAGIPAIVTPGTNMEEIIRKSGGGIVTALDEQEIAQSIKAGQLKSSTEIHEMGQKAKSWCQTKLSWDIIVDIYERYYLETIQNKN